MKFKPSEHKDITGVIGKTGFEPSDFHFIKRRGRIIVQHNVLKEAFSFFLKRPKVFVDAAQPDDISPFYEIRQSGKQVMRAQDWETLLNTLQNWLIALKKDEQKIIPGDIKR